MKVKILLVLFVLNSSYNFAQIDNYDSLNFTFDKLSLSEEYDSALVIAQQIKVYALQNNGDMATRKNEHGSRQQIIESIRRTT